MSVVVEGDPDVVLLPADGTGRRHRARRCSARSKRTGDRCRQPARSGFRVCCRHGAGTVKRERDGTRKPVRSGGLVHGRYAAPATVIDVARVSLLYAERVWHYRERPDACRDVNELLARLWAVADVLQADLPRDRVPPLVAALEAIRRGLETAWRLEGGARRSAMIPAAAVRRFVDRVVTLLTEVTPDDQLPGVLARFERLLLEPGPRT